MFPGFFILFDSVIICPILSKILGVKSGLNSSNGLKNGLNPRIKNLVLTTFFSYPLFGIVHCLNHFFMEDLDV